MTDIFDIFRFDRKKLEDTLDRFNFKPRISGSYKHNFAGYTHNMKTGEIIHDPLNIKKVDWVFYSNGKPNKLVFYGNYSKRRNELHSFLIFKYKKIPDYLRNPDSSWLYGDEAQKNMGYCDTQEGPIFKWLYENPAFYSKSTIDLDWDLKAMHLIKDINNCGEDCFLNSVNLERSRPLVDFLRRPLFHEKGLEMKRQEEKDFTRKVWNALGGKVK